MANASPAKNLIMCIGLKTDSLTCEQPMVWKLTSTADTLTFPVDALTFKEDILTYAGDTLTYVADTLT